MLTGESEKGQSKRRLSQRAAAWVLSVTYQHLNSTLKGKRESKSLMERYADLVKRHDSGGLTASEELALRKFEISGLASRALGVFPDHLISVLGGAGRDASLLARFRALAALSSERAMMLSMISRGRDSLGK